MSRHLIPLVMTTLVMLAAMAAGCTAPSPQETVPALTSPVQPMVTATPAGTQATLPVTFAPTAGPQPRGDLPQIHIDGYWTYPQGRDTTTNPVPLLVHTDAFNVGMTGAREVTVSANFWYQGRMICWDSIYLGTLPAGGQVSRDSHVTCTLPSGFSGQGLDVRFENLIVTP